MADTENQTSDDTMVEIGSTGLVQTSGFVQEEFLPQLKGRKAMRIYKEMRENEPILGAMQFTMESLIRNVDWPVEPADGTESAMAVAEFVESALHDMDVTWTDFIAEALSMIPFGFSYHEIVYKRRGGWTGKRSDSSKHSDGRIGWKRLPIRAQETLWKWELGPHGEILGLWQLDNYSGKGKVFIPIEKALHFRTTTHKGNPEGRPLYRSSYRPWYLKKNIEEIEAIGIERDLAGLPIMWVPGSMMGKDASTKEKQSFEVWKETVRRVKRNEMTGLVLPLSYDKDGNKRFDFQLAATGGRRQIDTNPVITRYERQIAQTALFDFIMLGHEKVGSFSLASEKTNMFSNALGAFLGIIVSQFNDFAIPDLMRVNGLRPELTPTLRHGDIEKMELEKVARLLQAAAGSGAPLFPDADLENWVRSLIGAPIKPEEVL